MKIGIIGQGFVGSALKEGLKEDYEIKTYDINSSLCNSSHEEVAETSDIIFVCVPTPMKKSGECDTSILGNVLLRLDHSITIIDQKPIVNRKPIVVIKSTVPPGTTKTFQYRCRNLDLCFSPEFLTEANSFNDFKNQTRIIIGGAGSGALIVKEMFQKSFPDIPIIVTDSKTAEMVKYFTNCFLTAKVIFANEMYDICKNSGINYDKVRQLALYDERIGKSHLLVPGPDGDRGFGGHCFPKDLAAMIFFAIENNIMPIFLRQIEVSNSIFRKNRDWESMKGRAVSNESSN